MDKDAKALLGKLADWAKSQGPKQEKRSSPWSWVTGLIVGAVAMFTAAILAWRAYKQGKELAKLKHEKDVAEQKQISRVTTEKTLRNEENAATLREEIAKSDTKIRDLDNKLKELEDVRTTTEESLKAAKSWRDIDRLLNPPNS